MIGHLDFLNKNMFRQYPIVGAGGTSIEGRFFPTSLISDIRITTTSDYGEVYISRVVKTTVGVSIVLSSQTAGVVIGAFTAILTSDFQTAELQTTLSAVSGHITFGQINTPLEDWYHFTYDDGRLEESAVYVLTPPPVTNIEIRGVNVTGEIDFVLNNLRNDGTTEIELNAINTNDVSILAGFNIADNTCPLGSIQYINDVQPDVNGNIDIYTIAPLVIDYGTGAITIDSPSFTLADYCIANRKNIAPEDDTSTYPDIQIVTSPEYLSWPQYTL